LRRSVEVVDKYKSLRKSLSKKPETINKELGLLRQAFNLAVERNSIPTNPIKGLKLLNVPNSKPRVLKDSEFQTLYNSASSHFKPILLCGYLTGMRRSEISKLKWIDVDLEDGYIHVNESKNGEYRSIPINELLLDTLRKLKKNSTGEYVFTSREGNPYISKTAWKTAWTNTLKKSQIEHCTFHSLRHSFISNLIVDEKEDYTTVMSLSGHKSIRMLQRYSHTHEKAKKTAISKLGKSLNLTSMDTYLDTKDKTPSIHQLS